MKRERERVAGPGVNGAAIATPATVAELRRARTRFDRPFTIDCEPAVRERTWAEIGVERSAIRAWLSRGAGVPDLDVEHHVANREGDGRLAELLEGFLADRDLLALDRQFAERLVSNPGSGELVKGHAIVLAELGLCPYRGKVVRDPRLFDGPWAKPRRAAHLIARLAFMQVLWSTTNRARVALSRGAAVDGPLAPRPSPSFVSATFSAAVAQAHFAGGPNTETAVIWRQSVPADRLLMTFFETPALGARFREAEAVLIGDPANPAF